MTFNLAIYGPHPCERKGFESSMVANFCAGFLKYFGRSASISIILPPRSKTLDHRAAAEWEQQFLDTQLQRIHAEDLEKLNVFFDLVIWQVRKAEDEVPYQQIKQSCQVLAKSFPRFFGNGGEQNQNRLLSNLNKFDLIAFALKEDYDIALEILTRNAAYQKFLPRIAFIERGFNTDWLLLNDKPTPPIILLDGIVRRVDSAPQLDQAFSSVIDALVDLQHQGCEFEVSVLRHKLQDLRIAIQQIKPMGVVDFYRKALSPASIYIGFNPDYSLHGSEQYQELSPTDQTATVLVGCYENQLVEVQLAGGLILADRRVAAEELLAPAIRDRAYIDLTNPAEISASIQNYLDQGRELQSAVSAWACMYHAIEKVVEKWIISYKTLIEASAKAS